MSHTLLHETKSVLAELKNLRKGIQLHRGRLSDYEDYTLINSVRKGSSKQYFYVKKKGQTKKKYLKENEMDIASNIKAARFCSQLLDVVNRDIELLERLDKDYIIPDHKVINDMLPKVYRSDDSILAIAASTSASDWKRLKEAEKAKYPPYRPEELKYPAQDGTMMRSLSEVIIANYLISLGITFIYELPLISGGKMILPDFTILSPVDNKTIIIIEHQGAMNSENYQNKFLKSVLFYLNTSMVPNKDVFFTFNHLSGKLDLRQIDYILRAAFGYTGQQYS